MTSVKATLSAVKFKSLKALSVPAGSTLVLGLAPKDGGTAAAVSSVKTIRDFEAAFGVLAKTPGVDGKHESVTALLQQNAAATGLAGYDHVIALGVGSPKECHPQNLLSLGGSLGKALRAHKAAQVDVFLDSLYNPPSSLAGKDAPKDHAGRALLTRVPSREDALAKIATGLLLSLYTFDRYKKKKNDYAPKIRFLSAALDDKKMKSVLERVETLARAVYLTRDLQTTPGGDMQPAEIARQAQEAGRKAGFKTTVWDEKKLKEEGMNGILTVGQGSEAPPRFIIMEHNAGKKNLPTIVLVGKGVSFDTGGISIKPAAGMEEMKMDMSGAASVIGAMHAIAELKVPVHVVGLVASAENMPSGSAVRPGDIFAAHDGQTVEVINTDAEGRLVLCDALSYAKTYKPDAVIDMATLTGAVVVALGAVSTGMMGNNASLLEGFKKASSITGEKVWELPLYDEYKEDMRSKVADYRNSGNREGGSQKGGTFLNFFVQDAYPWIHLDIAGTADTPKGQGAHCPPDVGTGVPVASVVEFVSNLKDYFKVGAKKA
jgi:leucyl aminopeptidase